MTEEAYSILFPLSYASHYQTCHMLLQRRSTIYQFHCDEFNVLYTRNPIIMILYVINKYMDFIKA